MPIALFRNQRLQAFAFHFQSRKRRAGLRSDIGDVLQFSQCPGRAIDLEQQTTQTLQALQLLNAGGPLAAALLNDRERLIDLAFFLQQRLPVAGVEFQRALGLSGLGVPFYRLIETQTFCAGAIDLIGIVRECLTYGTQAG
nr:hypothetical protein [Marinicella sp. W31]MDC2877403.1 hypothetical protein [Marinicella sp. W31]